MADPLFLEALEYNAIEVRQLIAACLSAGVVGAGDLEVTAGDGTTVDVAAGLAVVAGTDNDNQGNYVVLVDADEEGVEIAAAPGSNSRIDVVYLKVRDDTEDSNGDNDWIIGVEEGTPSADPAAPTIPDTALPLAEVLVTAGDTASTDYTITDVRGRAVGSSPAVLKTSTLAGGTSGFTTETTVMTLDIPAQPFPYRATIYGRVWLATFGGGTARGSLKDGSSVIGQVEPDVSGRVTIEIAYADLEVSDGAAKTIDFTILPAGFTGSTLVDTDINLLRAEIHRL